MSKENNLKVSLGLSVYFIKGKFPTSSNLTYPLVPLKIVKSQDLITRVDELVVYRYENVEDHDN